MDADNSNEFGVWWIESGDLNELLVSGDYNPSQGTWYSPVVEWSDSDKLDVTVYEWDGTKYNRVESLSTTDNRRQTGKIGFHINTRDGKFDNYQFNPSYHS